jgi:sulfate-transporting ATPase
MLATEFFTQTTIRFAVFGMATGSLYGLVALAVNLVHRSSGVLNFAASALGAISAFAFYDLRDHHGWNWPLALTVALVLGAALGAATYVVLMRMLRSASPLTKVIATLGLFTSAGGLIELVWRTRRGQVDSILPTDLVQFTDQIVLTQERIIIIALVLALTTGLWLLYSKTFFGVIAAAVAESPRVVAAAGMSPGLVQLVSFTLGGLLSALAAILLAPIVGLNGSVLSLMTIGALAAALVGRFSSFSVTVAAAMGIGIVQAELAFFQPDIAELLGTEPNSLAGLPSNVPFLIVIVMTVLGGEARAPRSTVAPRLPRPGTGRVNRLPLLVAFACTVPIVATLETGWAKVTTLTFISAIVLSSVVVVTGLAGQLSLCQYALGGFGAWMSLRFMTRHGWGLEVAVVGGIASAALLGALVALPTLRTRGVHLAVVTLGLALMMQSIVFGSALFGSTGGPFELPDLFGIDIDPVEHPNRYALVALVAMIGIGLLVANLRRGDAGRRLLAVRSNERAAASLGVGVYGAKVYAFALGAAIASVGGILFAFRDSRPTFRGADVYGSVTAVLYSVFGGVGWATGAVIGATLSPGALNTRLLNDYVPGIGDVGSWLLLGTGVLVIVMLSRSPDGVAALIARARRRAVPLPETRAPADTTVERPRRPPRSLSASGVTVRFGGVVALDGADLTIRPGEIVGLIGPNGAGKTTLLDVMSGFTRPDGGQVHLDGRAITEWSPERRARAGVIRSWQQVELFEELSVMENLLVAADAKRRRRYLLDLVHPRRGRLTSTMHEVIDELQLRLVLGQHPSSLPHGVMRLVGIARAVAADPSVLLLDEPAAGLSDAERAELGDTVRRLARRLGVPVLVTEHDVPLLMRMCDRLVALDFGRVIADGTPDDVSANHDVIRSYLGEPLAIS